MSQAYKSYNFYDINGSDNDEEPKKTDKPSRLAEKQEKKKMEKNKRQESSDSSSEDEDKTIAQGPPKDVESEFAPKNTKKVKTDDPANKKKVQPSKKKSDDILESPISNNAPESQNLNATQQKTSEKVNNGDKTGPQTSTQGVSMNQNTPKRGGLTPPPASNSTVPMSQNSSFQTVPNESSSIEQMNIENPNLENSRVEGNNSNILGNSNNESFTEPVSELDYSSSNIPTNILNQNILSANFQTPSAKQPNFGPNESSQGVMQTESDSNESSVKQTVRTNEKVTASNREVTDKKKSGKYRESSSSRSSSPSPPRNVAKPQASAESRQKSKLSMHLKSIKENMKAQEQEGAEPEVNTLPSGSKPKFFVDTTPIGIIQEEGEAKKLVPQVTEMETEDRQYRILGQERAFRTQEKNLLEKLNKFFVEKEEDKKEEDKEGKEDEETKEIDDEFNFESRYFMYNPTKVCNRCKKAGHFERWCPEDVLIKCLFCVGHHRTDDCTQVVCFHCYGVGHRARDCDAPGSLVCFRCGKRGHKSTNCGMMVFKESTLYKEKKDCSGDIKCMKCGRYGHAKCSKDSHNKRGSDSDKFYHEERKKKADQEREEMNMKILSRAKDIQRYDFEGTLSDESYEDLSNFKPAYRSNYEHKGRNEREKEILREIKKEKADRHRAKDRERHSKKKKSRRY